MPGLKHELAHMLAGAKIVQQARTTLQVMPDQQLVGHEGAFAAAHQAGGVGIAVGLAQQPLIGPGELLGLGVEHLA